MGAGWTRWFRSPRHYTDATRNRTYSGADEFGMVVPIVNTRGEEFSVLFTVHMEMPRLLGVITNIGDDQR